MLLFSHKMVFIENETRLLCVAMRERARASTCSKNLVYNFLIYILLLRSSVFVGHFSNAFWHGNEAFPKGSSQNQIFPVFVIFHQPHSKCRGVKIYFYLCHYQNQNFSLVSHSCRSCSTRVALVSFVQQSCRTCISLVLLVPHSCRTHAAFVSLVSHWCSCRSCLALVL